MLSRIYAKGATAVCTDAPDGSSWNRFYGKSLSRSASSPKRSYPELTESTRFAAPIGTECIPA
ncbi:keratin, type II cytoskeletal 80 [Methylocaldum marinum]|uniref:Keratin, type II cytoskeletal 80 n=1 Tax=Methylocaldum marinum TaxID=1432792 RepID=A0A286P3C6_9GAMM|nr:keratin, type II cytoskeletal 80 [Methylocaldum marinum]